MKRSMYVLAFLLAAFRLHGWDGAFSVSYQPFAFLSTGLQERMSYSEPFYTTEYTKGQYMVYQADLKHRSGFNFGFGLNYDSGYDMNDNLVGRFSDIFGYLGFRRFSVRVTHFSIPGTNTITGNSEIETIVEGQPRSKDFTYERNTVELLYHFGEENEWRLGIYYQHLTSAHVVEVGKSDDPTNKYSKALRHVDYRIPSYGLIFGIDSFSSYIEESLSARSFFFHPWVEMWCYAGFGAGTAIGTEETIDDGYEEGFGAAGFDFNTHLTLGILFGTGRNIVLLGGIGYTCEFIFGGFLRHGLIIRGGIKW